MSTHFDLTNTSTEFPPAFLTVTACSDWLVSVPLANPAQAQVMLLRQLNLLNRFTLAASARLKLLESLRQTVIEVQRDVSKKFANKPLPLSPPEQAAFDGTIAVWQGLLGGYLRVFDAVVSNDASVAEQGALAAQRALSVFADWEVDLCRGEKLPDGSFWRRQHSVFALAEQRKLTKIAVGDAARHGNESTTVLAAYAESHLLHTASPFELPSRHLDWIARWSRRWSNKPSMLSAGAPTDGTRAVPLFVDLDSDRPAGYSARDVPGARWLDTDELRKSIKARLVMLQQGELPKHLQLGEDCTQPATSLLLERVYQRWCKGGAKRRQDRHPVSGGCEFIVGFEAVHYYLSGRKPFRPPVVDETMLRKERDELETFGHRAQRQEAHYSDTHGYQVEDWSLIDDWQLLDQSANGVRLQRQLKSGVRVGSGQLIAIKMGGSSNFMVGSVRWILQEDGEPPTVSIGIQLFPGKAQPVAVRLLDPKVREPYKQGMRLPAMPTVNEPATIITPVGTFRINGTVEVLEDGITERLALSHVLDRGSEFERCSFEPSTERKKPV